MIGRPTVGHRTKTLVLTDSFLPHAGGSREYYFNIYRKLAELGDSEVSILTKRVDGWEQFDREASTELFRIHRRFKPLASWKYKELPKGILALIHAAWHVFGQTPSIIHAGDLYPPGVIAMILKSFARLPYVVYCHGEEITQTDRFRYQPMVRDRIYKRADAVIANSQFAKQNLLRIGVRNEQIHMLTPGVDCARFRPMPPKRELVLRYGLEGKIVLLTVARLIPRKGHRVALQAFAQVIHDIPQAHYLVVGTGPEEQRLREFVQQAGLGGHVTFAGYVPAEQLPDIYNLGDIFLMPNRQEENGDVEGFGIVFLEANAAGKPVIGGRSGGAIEAIADGTSGFLVNPDDADELAACLQRLLLDRSMRERLGSAGLQRARMEFDWKLRAESLREINRLVLRAESDPKIRERLTPQVTKKVSTEKPSRPTFVHK